MRNAIWPAAAAACALLGAWTASASAGGFHTIPRLTPALDYRTGQQYYAPPIPYGHYVGKQIPEHVLGAAHGAVGLVHLPFGHIRGKLGGLFHHGRGGHGLGHGCSDCGGAEWGDDSGIIDAGPGYDHSFGGPSPIIQGQTFGAPAPIIQSQPTGQITPMSGQVIGGPAVGPDRMIYDPALRGTGLGHIHASNQSTGGLCGPGLPPGGSFHSCDPSWHGGACGQGGCHGLGGASHGLGGACHDLGEAGHGLGGACHGLGGAGHGLGGACHGLGGGCGGHGGHGGLGHGLLSWPHSALGALHGLPHTALGAVHGVVGTIFHTGDIKYFNGPGGPVPLTPGYVPYIVTTRSPRDYFAFPPFSTLDP